MPPVGADEVEADRLPDRLVGGGAEDVGAPEDRGALHEVAPQLPASLHLLVIRGGMIHVAVAGALSQGTVRDEDEVLRRHVDAMLAALLVAPQNAAGDLAVGGDLQVDVVDQ